MPDHDGGPRAETATARKLRHLLAGDYMLYELTGDRQMRVLHLPVRLSPPAASAGRAFPRGAAEGRRAP